MENNSTQKLPFITNSNLRPIILGILIVIAGFATFNIFNKFAPGTVDTKEENSPQQTKKTTNVTTKDSNNKAVLSEGISQLQSTTVNWAANDYKQGDIKTGTYTVVKGDTLWEISEAVYGTGSNWHQIEKANNITYLSNGNPLIIPGQELVIPKK